MTDPLDDRRDGDEPTEVLATAGDPAPTEEVDAVTGPAAPVERDATSWNPGAEDGTRSAPVVSNGSSGEQDRPAGRREVTLRVPVPRAPTAVAGGRAALRRWAREAGRGLRGIRGRVVASYVLLVAGALLVSLLVVRQVLIVQADAQIEEDLAQEVEELRILATGVDPATGEPFGGDVAAVFDTFLARNVPSQGEVLITLVDGRPYLETLGAPVDLARDPDLVRRWSGLTEPLRLDVGEGAEAARTLAVPLMDGDTTAGVFVVAIFPESILAEIDDAVRAIGGVGLVVLAVAALVALALARQVLRPVDRLTAMAQRISDNDLSVRFAAAGDDELARLGAAFDDMLDRLERGFETQREVLDDVAHELRTPITIVAGHLELLEDDPDERAATVALCMDELDRMSRYVDDLLLVASAQRPDFLSPGPVDVGELAEGLVARIAALGERDWVLVAAPPPGSEFVVADAQRLTQAVVNLAGNAVEHTGDGDRIELRVDADPDEVRLSVRDHGPGVAVDVRDQLFGRFSRAARSRSRRPEGTGLGLAIVAGIAEAHGGRVVLEDPAGGGARFVITLPRTAVDRDPEEP